MANQAPIVTVTLNPSVDVACWVDHVVAERKLRCSAPQRDPGGGGLNVAKVVRELGGHATALWSGGGTMGALLGTLLDRDGVVHRPVEVSGETRENLTVGEESSERQYRFVMPGPTLTDGEMSCVVEALSALDLHEGYLVLSGSLPPGVPEDFYLRLAQAVHTSNRIVIDASGACLRRSLEGHRAYLVKPNLRELADLVDRELGDEADLVAASRQLVADECAHAVVLSVGAGGAMVVTAHEVLHFRAPTVPIRSKVGAGDSMVAAMTLTLARGGSFAEAARYGVAAGAAAVMTPGTKMCSLADTQRLHGQMISKSFPSMPPPPLS